MTFLEAIELVKQRIDETDADEQIINIVKNGINKAYFEVKTKIIPDVDVYDIEVENGVADLPYNYYQMESMPFKLKAKERIIGNKIFLNSNGIFPISYITTPNLLEDDSDELTIPYSLAYACTTYACYAYYLHRKKDSLSSAYLSDYQYDLMTYLDNGQDEVVSDFYEGE